MISRLTFSAAVFAILAAATVTFAAESHQRVNGLALTNIPKRWHCERSLTI